MLATQTPDTGPEAKDVKQWIKEKLAWSLKALQKRYVTTDVVVTSEDGDANLLCCALEAIFIHGIKSKYVRSEAGGRGRKGGSRGALPQPVFWSLLKTVTHGDVITELEKLSFVGTDTGRCRAWLRLALNHGLMECYLASLFREGSKLQAHYQPSALLLDPEEREVLLSYIQGLASLTFNLSYKSAVLNEWTTTPLALAGLCPAAQAEALDLPFLTKRKESYDTVSQSSGGSDTVEVQRGGPGVPGKGIGGVSGFKTPLNSSNLSLDTTGSSQLSSSLSSDSLLQGHDPKSPDKEPWPCDLEISNMENNGNAKRPLKDVLADFRESAHSSQDSMREDSYVSTPGADHLSENTAFSGSDSETQGHVTHLAGPSNPASLGSDQEEPSTKTHAPSNVYSHIEGPSSLSDCVESTSTTPHLPVIETPQEKKTEYSVKSASEPSAHMNLHRTTSALSRTVSTDSVTHSHSWISEDDIYKPHLEELADPDESLLGSGPACVNGFTSPPLEPETPQSPPSVVHRRQIGLSNPFRGLLKLGHLERRGTVGMWRDYYCELSPFEFRLYLNAEERTCCDNCSLLRCEDACVTSAEGRFDLAFPGKRLLMRAANCDEAEDWVDRITEAVNKCRPLHLLDDQWEVLQLSDSSVTPDEPPKSSPSSPSSVPASPDRGGAVVEQERQLELDWTRPTDPESDAIKEAVLYFCQDSEARNWTPLVFSLSLETLKGFRMQDGQKVLRCSHPIEGIRDVVPDVSMGGPAFFRVVTARDTLKLRAKSSEEAQAWRGLIRGALNSYLESGEDWEPESPGVAPGAGGNTHRLVQHRLKGDGVLLAHLCTVPTEKGLDLQGFKCAGCPKVIGVSRGKARLCEFSGQYYCDACHQGDTIVIPSRMVHNWDLAPREVSRHALKLLAQIEHEPLLNLDLLNPDLWEHAEAMAQTQSLRQRLRLLGDYLLTCRSGACKSIQTRLGPRTYLLESSDLYSVMDLRQIAEGMYVAYLNTLIQFASNHVHHCDLCTQRGFICQICHTSDIIFPFQFDTTTRCKECKAVSHLTCKAKSPSCPRCLRLQRYLERDLQD
ncbi:pleckstrin homology domain-containing family M member 1-like isoform X1 [Oncorhynchus masou masou]|uniref:pleckstrin homology domain-containing family M member 1-like isoform X1 n=2 Tax=Oncorhynchus masou masou TaxID=90313 RepID=UPI00318455FA